MNRLSGWFVSACLLLAALAPIQAEAVITWVVRDSGGGYLYHGFALPESQVVIQVHASSGIPSIVHVYSTDPEQESIGQVYLYGTVSYAIHVHVDDDSNPFPPMAMYPDGSRAGCVDWHGLREEYAGPVTVSACIGGDATGDVTATYLDYVFVNGAIKAPVTAGAGVFRVRAGSVAQGADVTCTVGNLTAISVVQGSLRGHVYSMTGNVGLLNVTGDIGAPGQLVKIYAATDVHTVSGANVYADIWPDAYPPPNTGTLANLITTGDFAGVARTRSFTTMSIGRDLVGTLAIEGVPFPAGKQIDIGRSLGAAGLVYVTTAGALGGQIVLNKNDAGGAWALGGQVKVGLPGNQIALVGPTYSTMSSALGGGAVGLAPFSLHLADCIPPQQYNTVGATMTIRHYGPVAWAGDGDMPVTVEYRLSGNPNDPWTDITDDFIVTTGPTSRDVVIVTTTTLDFDALVDYRVRPVRSGPAMLRCVGVGGGQVPVADYEYIVP